jgi:hypothetical protein
VCSYEEGDVLRKGRKAAPAPVIVEEYRINNQIRVKEVRLIDENNQNVGVVSIADALERAQAIPRSAG